MTQHKLPKPDYILQQGPHHYKGNVEEILYWRESSIQALLEEVRIANLTWAVQRWYAEVKDRPLENKHRRTLDDTWRQVVRQFGGDLDVLLGPSHDAMLAQLVEKVRHL